MREIRLSGSVEGVVSNHDPYSDSALCQQHRDWLRNFVDHDAGWPNRDPRVQLRCQKVRIAGTSQALEWRRDTSGLRRYPHEEPKPP
jgi:hypothetical protein